MSRTNLVEAQVGAEHCQEQGGQGRWAAGPVGEDGEEEGGGDGDGRGDGGGEEGGGDEAEDQYDGQVDQLGLQEPGKGHERMVKKRQSHLALPPPAPGP